MNTARDVLTELERVSSPTQAVQAMRFFKTGKGQYGEGDVFIGIKSPDIKKLAQKYARDLDLKETEELLRHPYHEARSLALTLLTLKFPRAEMKGKEEIVRLYLKNREFINNWDLVDISAYKILGQYVFLTQDSSLLYELARSNHLWSERMSIIACLYLIKKGDFTDIRKLAVFFLSHPHDLMHKAVGWMLREMGKADPEALRTFLDGHAREMPRTALRYAIERLPADKRKYYLSL
ncbi:MAG: DNA alkylation repair protein [Alphaproteobacteria bacterium]